jgi:hypothetical protein
MEMKKIEGIGIKLVGIKEIIASQKLCELETPPDTRYKN